MDEYAELLALARSTLKSQIRQTRTLLGVLVELERHLENQANAEPRRQSENGNIEVTHKSPTFV